jgi:acyl dehydratase
VPETTEKPHAGKKTTSYPDFVGKTYVLPDYYEIGREQVRAFAKAVRNFDPIHHDEKAARAAGFPNLVCPPTFASIIGLLVQEHLFENIVKDYDLSQTVQAEQRFSFVRPICVGERLECSVKMLNMRQAVGVDIVETENVGKIWGTDEVVLVGYTKVAGYTGAVMEESLKDLVRNVMMHGRSIF